MRALHDEVDRFVNDYLPDTLPECGKSKFFHDPLWGAIELYPYELCIVDTPLFQRLRQIHQTGNVFATYPSAMHTRFEHSIGALCVADKIISQLALKYPENNGVIKKQSRTCVRLAALCHDLGHGPFSHTSEEFYSNAEDMLPLRAPKGEFSGKGGGEILSYLIVTSKSFREYYEKIKVNYPELKEVSIDNFAPLILGRRAHPDRQFEADIISGPFDADKLDYFPRDGRAVGLEIGIDISRLLHTLDIGKVPDEKTGKETHCLIVSIGGYNSIQQLLFARATLFSTVYHHHKVRACDCMVKACYEHFVIQKKAFCERHKRKGVTLLSAADYLRITDMDFFAEGLYHDDESPEHMLLHDLLYRRLLKRVLVISTNTIFGMGRTPDGATEAQIKLQRVAYGNFINLRKNSESLREHVRAIAEAAALRSEMSRIWFDIPKPPSLDKAGGAMINVAARISGKCELQSLSKFIPVDEWVRTYEQFQSKSYMFGPDDAAKRRDLAISAIVYFSKVFMLQLTRDAVPGDIQSEVIAKLPPGTLK